MPWLYSACMAWRATVLTAMAPTLPRRLRDEETPGAGGVRTSLNCRGSWINSTADTSPISAGEDWRVLTGSEAAMGAVNARCGEMELVPCTAEAADGRGACWYDEVVADAGSDSDERSLHPMRRANMK